MGAQTKKNRFSADELIEIGLNKLKSKGQIWWVSEQFDWAVKADPNHAYALALRGATNAARAYWGFPYYDTYGWRGKPGRKFNGLPVPHMTRDKLRNYENSIISKTFNNGLRDVEKAVILDPVDSRVLMLRGYVYMLRSDFEGPLNLDQAIKDFDKAIMLDTGNADAYFLRAWAYDKKVPYSLQHRIFLWFKAYESQRPNPTLAELEGETVRKAVGFMQKEADELKTMPDKAGLFPHGYHYQSYFVGGNNFNSVQAAYDIKLKWLGRNTKTPKQLYEMGKKGVVALQVTIQGKSWLGTGFFPSNSNILLTNAHVVEPVGYKGKIEVIFIDGRRVMGTVIAIDSNADLAACTVPGNYKHFAMSELSRIEGIAPTSLAFKQVPEGTKVIAIGHPRGLTWSMTTGIISARRKYNYGSIVDGKRRYKGVELLQTDTALNPGNSGGPVLNYNGKIIGIVSGGGLDAQGLNFIISSREIIKFKNKYRLMIH
ncbi:MAG: trypsin-like serine protease [Candidatus Aminicenantes bacterium]|nr:trypsin-like serine protease [Candidatus Aminicenantes bacterium]NIN42028.1 trypsin-like serine protease [Candidatus Aminicenantes bacterium]NIN84784.1 trypsin-like serine protease [Candidatus Aminicenantes bacterium]NIR05573.1 trypsin-like serine protease [Candidatus Aminicenantes bacterium]NIT22853.1 trypsin-like serine protease [Candidatus Aminicenantes bacterium]